MARTGQRGVRRWLVDVLPAGAGVVSVLLEPASIAIRSVIGLVFTAAAAAGAAGPR